MIFIKKSCFLAGFFFCLKNMDSQVVNGGGKWFEMEEEWGDLACSWVNFNTI